MAISEDTAALIAAQLTVAWSNVFGRRDDAPDLSERRVGELVEGAYARMLAHVKQGVTTEPAKRFDMGKLIE